MMAKLVKVGVNIGYEVPRKGGLMSHLVTHSNMIVKAKKINKIKKSSNIINPKNVQKGHYTKTQGKSLLRPPRGTGSR